MTGSFGKRMLWLIAIAAVASAAAQIMSCSSPLTTEDVTGRTDTVVVIIQVADTVFLVDTLYTPADTIFVPVTRYTFPAIRYMSPVTRSMYLQTQFLCPVIRYMCRWTR